MRYLSLIILLTCCTRLLARQAPLPQVTCSITEKDGLCDNNINCFFQDHRGIMWVGTNYGLNSIDGSRIISYHAGTTTQSLSDDAVHDMEEDDQHRLWMTTGHGLNCLDLNTGVFSKYFVPEKTEAANRLYSLCIQGEHIFIATEYGLQEFNTKERRFTLYKVPSGRAGDQHMVKLLADSKKRIWIGTYSGLWQFDPARKTFIPRSFSAEELITDIYEDHRGDIWAGTWDKGLQKIDPQAGRLVIPPGITGISSNITSVTELQTPKGDRQLWVSPGPLLMNAETHQLNPVSFSRKTDNEPITCNRLFTDRNNLLWIGTNEGIRIFDPSRQYFNTVVLSDYIPLSSQGVSLWPLKGRFLMGAEGSSALILFSDSLKKLDNLSSRIPAAAAVMNIFRDNRNDTWLCTSQGLVQLDSVFRFAKMYRHTENVPSSLPKNFLNCILRKNNGDYWLMPWRKGVWKFAPSTGQFTRILLPSKDTLLPGANIAKVLEDRYGNTWLADYSGGLLCYNAATGSVQTIISDLRLTNMVIDGDKLWTVSAKNVYEVNTGSGKIQQWSLPKGKDKYEYDFINGDHGWLWIATKTGLLAFNRETHVFKSYTEDDGLYSDNMDGSFVRLSNGNILFAGATYATSFSPLIAQNNEGAQPPLLFSGAGTDSREKNMPDGTIHINWNEHNIRLNWALLNLSNPLGNQYFCLLEGVDKEWRSMGNKGEVTYNSLPPGEYSFHYRAATPDGQMSETKTIHLKVHPPFWKQWWFILLAALVIAVLFFFLVKYISQRNLKERLLKLEKEQAIEKERNRISRDMHDELGSGLTKIAILSEVVKQQKGADAGSIDKISDTARLLVDNLDEMVWALNPQNDSLDKLIAYIAEYAHQFLEGTGIICDVNLPAEIPQDPLGEEKRRHIFMSAKEFLNNSVKYSGTKTVHISLLLHDTTFELLFRDEGKGFDPAKAKGNGTSHMVQRITDAGGRAELLSAPGAGTQLRIIFGR